MALVALALFLTACSGSGVSRSKEVQPVYLQDTAIGGLGSGLGVRYDRIVSNYLEGDATLEELAEVFEVADPIEVPVDELWGGIEDTPEEVLQRFEEVAALEISGYDNGDEPHDLSLSAVARYYSNRHISWIVCGLRGCFEDALLPAWWDHAIDVYDDSYHDYAFRLENSLRDHFYYSRLYPLSHLHALGLGGLYCLETIGMDVEGLAETLLLDTADGFDLWNVGVYRHDDVIRRSEEMDLTEADLVEASDDCGSEETVLMFPYPFDVAQAHRLLQEYFLEFLQGWVVEHQDEQPATLTIVD